MLFDIKYLGKKVFAGTFFVMVITSQLGCAVHYYDKKTATEHIWGFGHMKMRMSAPEEGVETAVSGIELYSFGISKGKGNFSLLGGWSRQTELEVVDEPL